MRSSLLGALLALTLGIGAAAAAPGNPCGRRPPPPPPPPNPCGGNPCGGGPDYSKLCEKEWPERSKPKIADTQTCVAYYFDNYADNSVYTTAIIWKLTAAQFKAMAKNAEACGKRCPETQRSGAIDFFTGAADLRWKLVDPSSNDSWEPLLEKALTGKKLTADEVAGVSSVTLWRLRNAPYARHGRPFKSPDLQTFFYGSRGPDAEATTLLPLKPNPAFKDSMLDRVDEFNVGLVVKEIKSRGEE